MDDLNADAARWGAVDRYFEDLLAPADPMLEAALDASVAADLPPIAVAGNQGKLLKLIAGMLGTRRILEIGTLGGYSTIWLARALPPDGLLVTLEAEPRHAAVARTNLARAGLAGLVEIRVGPAADSLAALEREGATPFDLVFIDADKPSNPAYLAHVLRLTRAGSVIVADNMVREGAVLDPHGDADVQGIRRFAECVAAEPRLEATVVQTVGAKGYDGLLIARVVADP